MLNYTDLFKFDFASFHTYLIGFISQNTTALNLPYTASFFLFHIQPSLLESFPTLYALFFLDLQNIYMFLFSFVQ